MTLKEQILDTANLEKDFDSYDSEPPSALVIQRALDLIELIGEKDGRAAATCDESILISYKMGNLEYVWDVYEKDIGIGLMVKEEGKETVFLDI